MKLHIMVYFNNGTKKEFNDNWKAVIRQIDEWCEEHHIITTNFDYMYD